MYVTRQPVNCSAVARRQPLGCKLAFRSGVALPSSGQVERSLLLRASPDELHNNTAPKLSTDEDAAGEPEAPVQQVNVQQAAEPVNLPYLVMAGIAGLGVAETAYLTLTKFMGAAPVCPISGCDTVLNSQYAVVFGVPLSLLGLLAYSSMAITAFTASQQRAAGQDTGLHNTLLASGAIVMAGISALLVSILLTKFAGEPCVWCYTSAGLSLSLFLLVILSMPARQLASAAGPGLGGLAAAVLALYVGFGAIEPSNAGEEFELPYNAPAVTTSSSTQAVTLAQRLKAAGARMYGAFWCSHCFDQKQTFGKEAMASFPYEECYPNGWKRGTKVTDVCEAAGVRAFPTWVINGTILEGEYSLEELERVLDGKEPVEAPALAAAST